MGNPFLGPAIFAGLGQGANNAARSVLDAMRLKAYRERTQAMRDDKQAALLAKVSGGTYPIRPSLPPGTQSKLNGPLGEEHEGLTPQEYDDLLDEKDYAARSGQATLPHEAEGTPYVPRTGAAILHQGEEIIPSDQNPNNPAAAQTILGEEVAPAVTPPANAMRLAAGGTQSPSPFRPVQPVAIPPSSAPFPERLGVSGQLGANFKSGRLSARVAGHQYLKNAAPLPGLQVHLRELENQIEAKGAEKGFTTLAEAMRHEPALVARYNEARAKYDQMNGLAQEAAGHLIVHGIDPAALGPEHLAAMGIRTDPDFWESISTPPVPVQTPHGAMLLQTPALAAYRNQPLVLRSR